ncbi:ATP-binding protein [Fundicoccus culcitae]|uniref:ATP-binding protein n=1 Tax=Fundicoccus culcitae TaxID=2969821 RepID=A0ABY5PA31_9LACT|nr:ATP-binding protein [Fundicoccus culcitae]UUX35476.1 ATP-binding protein [Fundicoccus culcitae]UUX35477.1 ATP-binding protein [Fundicoccus culcitae]
MQYLSDRHLNKDVFQKLSTNKYLDEHKNIIFVGATGSGKSYLACALGKNACLSGTRVNYIRLPDLLADLKLARIEGRYPKVVKQCQKIDLLIIDEFLLVPIPQQAQQDILEVLERRYRLHSTIFCSQFKVDGWHERLGGGVLADAILDRALSKSQQILIEGEKSMRSRI